MITTKQIGEKQQLNITCYLFIFSHTPSRKHHIIFIRTDIWNVIKVVCVMMIVWMRLPWCHNRICLSSKKKPPGRVTHSYCWSLMLMPISSICRLLDEKWIEEEKRTILFTLRGAFDGWWRRWFWLANFVGCVAFQCTLFAYYFDGVGTISRN